MTRINWRDHAPHVSKRNVLVGNLLGPTGGESTTMGAHVLRQIQLLARHVMQPGQTGDYHVHADQEQVYYLLRGAGKMHVDEEIYPVRTGDLICLPATCYHQLINDGDDWIEHLLIAGAHLPEQQRCANAAAIAANGPAGAKLPIACRSWLDVSPVRSPTGALFLWRVFVRKEEGTALVDAPLDTVQEISMQRLHPRHATEEWSDPSSERVYYVTGGSGELSAGFAREPMREGDAIHLPARTEHCVSNPHDDWLEYLTVVGIPPNQSN